MPASVKNIKTSILPAVEVCYHCGEDCPDNTLFIGDKFFCCEGCKLVYEILEENDLCTYYDLEKSPGISLKRRKDLNDKFAFMDDPEFIHHFADYEDNKLLRATFRLPQIHCASCIWLLENLYRLTPGISHSKVNFLRKELYVSLLKGNSSLRQVAELLASLGYEPDLSLSDAEKKKNGYSDRRIYYKLGVTGFCFGNIMLLSFPHYLGLDLKLDQDIAQFFGYLNLLLALPILLYGGYDYFTAAWQGLKRRHLNMDVPIALGIITLFLRSAYEIVSASGGGYMDSLAGLVFFLLIGKWFQGKTYERISFDRDFRSYFPVSVTRKSDSGQQTVTVSQLKPGDTIIIRNGEVIPTDGLLRSPEAQLDYSFVTGESVPLRKKAGEQLFAGGRQTGQAIEIEVSKEVSHSYLTRLWNDAIFTHEKEDSLTVIADQVSRYFTPAILIIATLTAAGWAFTDLSLAVNVFTAILIVACPCALALAAPFTLGNALRIFGRQHLYLKNTSVIEQLTHIDHIVFDKTGTLTISQGTSLDYEGRPLSAEEKILLRSLAFQSSHPMSRRILEGLITDQEMAPVKNYEEIPGKGISGLVLGKRIKIGSAAYVGAERSATKTNSNASQSWVKIDNETLGKYTFLAKYREGLETVIGKLNERYKVSVLTGDTNAEEKQLRQLFGPDATLCFNQSPHDKLAFIRQLQSQGEKVMMIGDGLNDAGALRQSEVGMAVSDDINNFSPACDAILDGKRFSLLPAFLKYSRYSLNVVKGGFIISLLYNIVGLSFAIQGLLSPVVAAILMPLSSVTVVVFGTLLTTMVAKRARIVVQDDENHPSS